jgi:hypothetical protein
MSARVRDGGEPRRRMLRICLRICLIVAALLLVSAGSFFAYYAYRKWRADEAVGRAKASLGKRNLQDGILSLRGALRHRPDHVEPIALLPLCLRLALEIYRELLERHPEDRRLRAKVTALELQSGPEQDRDAARAALEALASDEELGLIALRALTQDALRLQDFPAALAWSGRACETPSAAFSDRMLRLQALFAANSLAYHSWLSDLEKDAFENPQFALELGKWKVMAMGPQIAAVWLESAPKGMQDNPAISGLLAECYNALERWEDLSPALGRG